MKKLICVLLALCLLLCGCGRSSEQEKEEILVQRRDTAEAEMRRMMSVLWRSDVDITYSTKVGSMGAETDDPDRVVRLVADRIYSGMPYTHGSGSGDAFLSFGEPDENGVYQMTGFTSQMFSGSGGSKTDNKARVGNNCADAVFWAWSRIGNSFSFNTTNNMTAARGCLPVGEYTTEDGTYKKTKQIAQNNGEEVMYKAYACLQKADAVVTYNGSGHAMMVASVNVVQNDAGIDPEASFVLVHEQFTGNYKNEVTYIDEKTGQTVYCLGGVDRKYTFAQLYSKGYLPITIKELSDPTLLDSPSVTASRLEWDVDEGFKGSISCEHKIAAVTVTVTDQQGTVIQQATCFTKESEHFLFFMSNFNEVQEQEVMRGSLDLEALAPGSYCGKIECLLGTGKTFLLQNLALEVE